jgi:hypothetical protein
MRRGGAQPRKVGGRGLAQAERSRTGAAQDPGLALLRERLEEILPTVVRGLKEIAECEDDRAAAQAKALLRKYGPDLELSLREREQRLRPASAPSESTNQRNKESE